MLFKIRAATFETNSSSAHAFVVFEDQGLQDAWQSNPDLLIDLEGENWISNHEVAAWDVFDESQLIEVNNYMLVDKYGAEWSRAFENLKEDWGDQFSDFSDTEISEQIAIDYELVPYDMNGFYEIDVYDGIRTWGELLSNAQDSKGRDVFTIIRPD